MASVMDAWLVDSIDRDLRRVIDGTIISRPADSSSDHWYETGSGLQVILGDQISTWARIVSMQAPNDKVVRATLSDTHRAVAVRFSQDSLKQAREKTGSILGPGAVGCYLTLNSYEICVSDSGPLDQRITLLVRDFKYKGSKSRDLLKPKPLATDPRIQATLRELSVFVTLGGQTEDIQAGSDSETGPASQPARAAALDSQQIFATQAPLPQPDLELLQGVNLSAPKEVRKQDGLNGVSNASETRKANNDIVKLLSLLEGSNPKGMSNQVKTEHRSPSASPPANGTMSQTKSGTDHVPRVATASTVHEGDFAFVKSLPAELDVPQDQHELLKRPTSWQYQKDEKKCSRLNLPSHVLNDLRARADGQGLVIAAHTAKLSDAGSEPAAPARSDPATANTFSEEISSNGEQPLSGSEWPESDHEARKAPKYQLPPDSSLEKPHSSSQKSQLPPETTTGGVRPLGVDRQHTFGPHTADDSAQVRSSPHLASQSPMSVTSWHTTTNELTAASQDPPPSQNAESTMEPFHSGNKMIYHSASANSKTHTFAEGCTMTQAKRRAPQAPRAATVSDADMGYSSSRKYGLFTRRKDPVPSELPSPRLPGSSPTSVVPATYNGTRENRHGTDPVTPQRPALDHKPQPTQGTPHPGQDRFSVHLSSDDGFEGVESSPRPHKKPRLGEEVQRNGGDHVMDLVKQRKRKFVAVRRAQKQVDEHKRLNVEDHPRHQLPPSAAGAVEGQQNSIEDVLSKFRSAYPSYTGDEKRFLARCRMVERLHTGKKLHRSLWDDFVIRHETDYLPYAQRCDEEGDDARPYAEYYHDEFDKPQHTRRVLAPDSLQKFLASDPARRASAGPEPFRSGAAATPPTTHAPMIHDTPKSAQSTQQPRGIRLPAKPPIPKAFSEMAPKAAKSLRPTPCSPSESDHRQSFNTPHHRSARQTHFSSSSRYLSGLSTSSRIPTCPRSQGPSYRNLTWRPPSSPMQPAAFDSSRRDFYSSSYQPSPLVRPSTCGRPIPAPPSTAITAPRVPQPQQHPAVGYAPGPAASSPYGIQQPLQPPSKPTFPRQAPCISPDTYVKSRLSSSRRTEQDHYDGRRRIDFAYRDWAP